MKRFLFVAMAIGCLVFFGAENINAMPSAIILMRHAEKPPQGNELSARGWERAKALPKFFTDRSEVNVYGLPVALYAMASLDGSSVRAIQTLKYVSQETGVAINSNYARDEVSQLVNEIRSSASFDGKLVVICWEHKVLSEIAQAFGVNPTPIYDSQRFDRAWRLVPNGKGEIEFSNIPERLLPGDDSN